MKSFPSQKKMPFGNFTQKKKMIPMETHYKHCIMSRQFFSSISLFRFSFFTLCPLLIFHRYFYRSAAHHYGLALRKFVLVKSNYHVLYGLALRKYVLENLYHVKNTL